jgi:uncharacterized protein YciI
VAGTVATAGTGVDEEGDDMQFLVVARDGTDDGAPARRRAVRPAHLEAIQPYVDAGNVLVGGAILSEEGEMAGSMLLVSFPDRDALDAWIEHDPYVTGDVWREVEVLPFRTAVGAWQPEDLSP